MRLSVASKTDVGKTRAQNQDRFACYPENGFFLVADGMGGHQGGETASQLTIENVAGVILGEQKSNPIWEPKSLLTRAIQIANTKIFEASQQEARLRGMGTTVTSLLFLNKTLTIGHVGDSRAYFFRDRCLWQITRDHSLIQEKFQAGLITREEMKTDPSRNVITRSVGYESKINVDCYEMEVDEGDTFLICSDGLSGLVSDAEMLDLLNDESTLEGLVENLVERANQNGGNDNITAVLIQVKGT